MKNENSIQRYFIKAVSVLILLLAGFLLAYIIYSLADAIMDNFLEDYIQEHFMVTYERYNSELGRHFVRMPSRYLMKRAIFIFLCVSIMSLVLLFWFIPRIYAKARVKKSISFTSKMLHEFMMTDKEISVAFPEEYREIEEQIAGVRERMQRHERMLREEAERKNSLITYLAHDLKTPLTSVIGYLSLLDEASDMPDLQREKYIRIALDKSQRLEKLINEFFEITRYNLQQMEIETESIDLYYMLVQLMDEFYPLLQAHGNTIELQAEEDITLYGDSVKLARVFNNILKNAIAYSYKGSLIKIWVEEKEDRVEIHFMNSGRTIPKQKLDSIFEKFFRLEEARTTNTGGAGLGLAIAKEIVRLHGGKITAESENEQTSFCVELPKS